MTPDQPAPDLCTAFTPLHTPPALPDDIKALLADTPKVTPEMRARLEQAAKDAAAPTPTLPPEVRAAVKDYFFDCQGEVIADSDSLSDGLCDHALAPLWPRPAPVTEGARALAERIIAAADRVFEGLDFDSVDFETEDEIWKREIAAVLAPVLRERDNLRAAHAATAKELQDERITSGGLRAEVSALVMLARQLDAQLVAAQEHKERMTDLLAASLRFIPAGAFYGDFATMTKEEGSLVRQVAAAIAAARQQEARHD